MLMSTTRKICLLHLLLLQDPMMCSKPTDPDKSRRWICGDDMGRWGRAATFILDCWWRIIIIPSYWLESSARCSVGKIIRWLLMKKVPGWSQTAVIQRLAGIMTSIKQRSSMANQESQSSWSMQATNRLYPTSQRLSGFTMTRSITCFALSWMRETSCRIFWF